MICQWNLHFRATVDFNDNIIENYLNWPYLRKLALFINQGKHVARLVGQKVEDVLVVAEFDVVPHYAFFHVLLLLQLEDVAHKELLKLLVGIVDAKLLKAGKQQITRTLSISWLTARAVWFERVQRNPPHLFTSKFSKPKISSRPMER